MAEVWNQLYTQVTYNRVKSLYETKFELGIRILNPRYVAFDNNRPPIQYDQKAYEIMSIELGLKTDDSIFKYWFKDLNKNMQLPAEHFYEEINKKFESERNMYANGTAALTEIDGDIQWLLMLNMCYQSAFGHYKYFWELAKKEQKWTDFRNLSMQMMNSLKNFNNLLNDVIQRIASRRDYLIQSNKERSWSDGSRAAFVEMQVWFDEITTVICDTCRVIKNMQLCDPTRCSDEFEQIINSLGRLFNLTLVLEDQPPEIVKADTNFSSKVRILLTLNNFNINELTVKIHHHITPHFKNKERAGEVKMTKKFEFKIDKHYVCSESKHIKVCYGIGRIRSEESVIANRYVLKYCLKLNIFKMEYTASIDSWPILVIVHQNQEAMANAANMWDKHFPDVDRINNLSVPWPNMCVVLKPLFKNKTKCDLNDDHLYAIHEKALRDGIIDGEDFLWERSCKAKYKNIVNSKLFSFWEWLYEIMKIVRDHIKALWEQNLVDGFVKESDLDNLLNYPIGTFLLRFSESVLGAITVIGVEKNPKNGENKIYRAGPISRELYAPKNRSKCNSDHILLADIIRSLKQCTHLWMHKQCTTPKDQAFEKFYKKLDTNKDENGSGYKVIVTTFVTEDTNRITVGTSSQNPSDLNERRSDVLTSPPMQNLPTPSMSNSCFGSPCSITSTPPAQSPSSVSSFDKWLNNNGLCYDTDESLCGNGEDSIMEDLSNSNCMGSTAVPTFSSCFNSRCNFEQIFNAMEGNHNWQTSNGNDQNQSEGNNWNRI